MLIGKYNKSLIISYLGVISAVLGMYFLELCNSSLGAVHKPYYFQMLFSGNRKGVCHFIANTLS